MHKDIKVGDIRQSNKFGLFEITEILPKSRVRIKFVDTGYSYICYKSQAVSGQVKDAYSRTVCGVGYIGDGKYSWSTHTKIYDAWNNMLKRCYDEDRLHIRPTWRGCLVCSDWQCFQSFAVWYESNKLTDNCDIDKDLLIKGNKVYSPETCVLIPNEINCAIRERSTISKSKRPGVFYRKKEFKYVAQLAVGNGKIKYLGFFEDEVVARKVYIEAKKDHIKSLAYKYRHQICDKAFEALISWDVTNWEED